MASENCVILGVDVSGSVGGSRDYWNYIRTLLDEVRPRMGNIPVVRWTSEASSMPVEEFITKYVEQCRGDLSTIPQTMVNVIETIVEENKIDSFELIITTDGQISDCDTQAYCEGMKNSKFYNKITSVRACFIGEPRYINTNLTHAFENVPIAMAINEFKIASRKRLDLADDERFTNFKIENFSSLVDDLAIQLSILPNTQENKSAVRHLLDNIKKKYLETLFATGDGKEKKDPPEVIHELLEQGKMEELKKYYLDLFSKQKDNENDKKINKLYSLLHKDTVMCYDLLFFVPEAMDTEFVKNQLEKLAEEEEREGNEVENEYGMNRERFCAIYYIESVLPVLQLQKYAITTILTDNKDSLWNERSRLACCPFTLFEHINNETLNDALLADYISAEAFVNLFKSNDDQYCNNFTFKSSCNTEAYGIMLYNYPESEVDLYETKNAELFKEITQLDTNIVNHICCIAADFLFGCNEIRGNRGLWAIAFLYSLYQTRRMQENEFLRRCIRYTIIRISLVFKCNVTLFKGVQPSVNLTIHDALRCSLHIASTVFQTDNNITRRLDENGPIFVQMMEKVFKQKIPESICFDDWFSWKYLFRLAQDPQKCRVLEPIIKTKVQDWINTQMGPLLLEGKTNDRVYDENIQKSKMKVLYKMIKALMDKDIQTTKGFNFAKVKVDIPADIDETKIRSVCTIDHHNHVKVCKSTCRPTFLCSRTGKPWYECVTGNLRETPVSFYNLYGKYVRKCKKFPTAEELMAFLVKKYPGTIYYKNTDQILNVLIEQFNTLDLDPKTFKKRYNSSTNEDRRIQMESDCKCPAHVTP